MHSIKIINILDLNNIAKSNKVKLLYHLHFRMHPTKRKSPESVLLRLLQSTTSSSPSVASSRLKKWKRRHNDETNININTSHDRINIRGIRCSRSCYHYSHYKLTSNTSSTSLFSWIPKIIMNTTIKLFLLFTIFTNYNYCDFIPLSSKSSSSSPPSSPIINNVSNAFPQPRLPISFSWSSSSTKFYHKTFRSMNCHSENRSSNNNTPSFVCFNQKDSHNHYELHNHKQKCGILSFPKQLSMTLSQLHMSNQSEDVTQEEQNLSSELDTSMNPHNDIENNDENDIPMPTDAGGYTHTRASKAKISAANKGKTPWNKGKARSEQVKARIAEGVRRKNRERFLLKLQELGLTEEEYEQKKKEDRRKKDAERRARKTENGGYRLTEETKQKISKILKEKHAKGEVKKREYSGPFRKGFKHSEETKRKIRESLKKKWAEVCTTYSILIEMVNEIYSKDNNIEYLSF